MLQERSLHYLSRDGLTVWQKLVKTNSCQRTRSPAFCPGSFHEETEWGRGGAGGWCSRPWQANNENTQVETTCPAFFLKPFPSIVRGRTVCESVVHCCFHFHNNAGNHWRAKSPSAPVIFQPSSSRASFPRDNRIEAILIHPLFGFTKDGVWGGGSGAKGKRKQRKVRSCSSRKSLDRGEVTVGRTQGEEECKEIKESCQGRGLAKEEKRWRGAGQERRGSEGQVERPRGDKGRGGSSGAARAGTPGVCGQRPETVGSSIWETDFKGEEGS